MENAGSLNRLAPDQHISLQFSAQPRKPLPFPYPGWLNGDQGPTLPPPFPDNPPGSSWRRHFPSGSKTQAPAKKTDTGFQNQPSFLMKMSTFWPSIPNWDENFTIKMPNSKGHVSAASSVWHASLLPCCLPGFSPSSAELTLCKVLGDVGALKETITRLAASVWICSLDS